MFILLLLFGTLVAVAIVATVRDIRADGYRRRPSQESEWGSQIEGTDRP